MTVQGRINTPAGRRLQDGGQSVGNWRQSINWSAAAHVARYHLDNGVRHCIEADRTSTAGGVRCTAGQVSWRLSSGLAATRPAMSFLKTDAAAALSGLRLAWSSKRASTSAPNPSQG
jgi:hypothetical protein